jgi:hypothetical protein
MMPPVTTGGKRRLMKSAAKMPKIRAGITVEKHKVRAKLLHFSARLAQWHERCSAMERSPP